MRLWVTRTRPGADRTAEALRRSGHDPVVQPVLQYRALPDPALDLSEAAALAFTSRNAVEIFAGLSGRRDLPVFAPGEATALSARDAGFEEVFVADGAAPELADLIAREMRGGTVVWPGPTEPAGDLVDLLGGLGVQARYQPIYETVAVDAPAPSPIDGVVIHSPKGAGVVADRLSPTVARGISAFAISAAAAAPLARLPFLRVAVAPRPNETALLALIEG
jgi:uroporphyrinogen-III synthase